MLAYLTEWEGLTPLEAVKRVAAYHK